MLKIKNFSLVRRAVDENTSMILGIEDNTNKIFYQTQVVDNAMEIHFQIENLDFIALIDGRIVILFDALKNYVNENAKIAAPKEDILEPVNENI